MADRIEQLRKQKGMSQEQLGLELGVSRQAVSKWESSQSKPDVDTVVKLCRLFEVSADWLLLGEEPQPQPVQYIAAPRWKPDRLDRQFILGMVFLVLGALGFLALELLSGGRNHSYLMDGWSGRGLWGYVVFYNLWPLVLLVCVLMGCGLYWIVRWLIRWLSKE